MNGGSRDLRQISVLTEQPTLVAETMSLIIRQLTSMADKGFLMTRPLISIVVAVALVIEP